MILFALILFACASESPSQTQNKSGWREVTPPRSDLQCWERWNRHIVCAQSLTSTHGASGGTN